jgi:hypothetical protein
MEAQVIVLTADVALIAHGWYDEREFCACQINFIFLYFEIKEIGV